MNRYFYIDSEGKQKGIFTPEELRAENIKRDTLVWANEMTDWKPANEVEELKFLFADSAGYYPPQNPTPPTVEYHQQPEAAHVHTHAPGAEQEPIPPMPKNWLVESVLITILPFVLCSSVLSLLGIVGIVSASRVESQYRAGDYDMAKESAKQAKRWTVITFWITIGWIIVAFIAVIIAMYAFGFSLLGLSDIFDSATYTI